MNDYDYSTYLLKTPRLKPKGITSKQLDWYRQHRRYWISGGIPQSSFVSHQDLEQALSELPECDRL